MCGCLSHTLYWGPDLQPRHVPWSGNWNWHQPRVSSVVFSLILFSSCCSDWMLFPSLCSKSLIQFLMSSPPLLVPYRFLFQLMQPSFLPGSFLCHWGTQWVPGESWWPVIWTVHLIGCLSPFHLVLVSVYQVELLWLPVLVVWPIVEKRLC